MYLRGAAGVLRINVKVKDYEIGQRQFCEVPLIPSEESKYFFTEEKPVRHKSLWIVLKSGWAQCLFCWYTTSLGSCTAPEEVFQLGTQSSVIAVSAAVCQLRCYHCICSCWCGLSVPIEGRTKITAIWLQDSVHGIFCSAFLKPQSCPCYRVKPLFVKSHWLPQVQS